mgnify:CR=1 FL=1
MLRARPELKFEWKEGKGGMRQVRRLIPSEVSDSEQAEYDEAKKPAAKNVIKAILLRLFLHKKRTEDKEHLTFLIKEFTDYLFTENATEFEVWATISSLIEDEDGSAFLPPMGDMIKKFRLISGYYRGTE